MKLLYYKKFEKKIYMNYNIVVAILYIKREFGMTYSEAVKKINSLLAFGIKPGLERVSELVRRLGSPDKNLKFVHIAGTNGKGSTCALIANTLTKAGYKTGMFISPYVTEFRERFQIDGKMIPKEELASITEYVCSEAEKMSKEGKTITEFELVFAVGIVWYSRQRCDIVVLETGLGGRFDATNIIDTPLVSVITSISLDHTAVLGDTYEKIAREKCGIIKDGGITVAYGEQPEGVIDVISESAAKRNNRLIIADTNSVRKISSGLFGSKFGFKNDIINISEICMPFIGRHQLKNAATALYTLGVLRGCGYDISDLAIKEGFSTVFFPARLELIKEKPTVLLDGAHNPGGAKALSEAIKENLSGKKKTAIIGMLADKDVNNVLSELLPYFDNAVTVKPNNPRALGASELADIVKSFGVNVLAASDSNDAYNKAMSLTDSNGAIVIFGSLYLASDMRQRLCS